MLAHGCADACHVVDPCSSQLAPLAQSSPLSTSSKPPDDTKLPDDRDRDAEYMSKLLQVHTVLEKGYGGIKVRRMCVCVCGCVMMRCEEWVMRCA